MLEKPNSQPTNNFCLVGKSQANKQTKQKPFRSNLVPGICSLKGEETAEGKLQAPKGAQKPMPLSRVKSALKHHTATGGANTVNELVNHDFYAHFKLTLAEY